METGVFLKQRFIPNLVLVLICSNTHGCTFCRPDHVGVHLSPYVSVEDEGIVDRYNSVPDLWPLINTVSPEFKIVVLNLDSGRDRSNPRLKRLFKAVATWNVNNSKSAYSTPMEIWVRLDDEFLDSFIPFKQFLTSAGKVFDEANSIYNKTVTSVSLYPQTWEIASSAMQKKLIFARTIFPRETFDLGIGAVAREFLSFIRLNTSNSDSVTKQIRENLDLLDFLEFHTHYDSNINIPVEVAITRELDSVKTCVQFIQENFNNTNISFVVVAGGSDTTAEGEITYSRFVDFWKYTVAQVRLENFKLIFVSAFDNPNVGHEPRRNTGWWRLRENGSYTSSSQFVFDTKEYLIQIYKKNTIENKISRLETKLEFSKSNFVIRFSPVVSTGDSIYRLNKTLISSLVSMLASKFEGILISESKNEHAVGLEDTSDLTSMLDVMAEERSKSNSSLSVTLLCELKSEWEAFSLIRTIRKWNAVNLNVIDNLAVAGKMVVPFQFLSHALSEYGIKVGPLLPIDFCSQLADQVHVNPPIGIAFAEVDFLYFSYIPTDPSMPGFKYGVDRVLTQVTSWFEICKRKISEVLPSVNIAFQTGYPDSYNFVNEDYTSLALFWKGMNSWAGETNTTVIMFEAFDSTHNDIAENYTFEHMGWWKIMGHPTNNNDLEIKDKQSMALQALYDSIVDDPPEEIEKSSSTSIVAIILPILATIFLFIVLFAVYRIRKSNTKAVNDSKFEVELTNLGILTLPKTAFVQSSSKIIGMGNFGTVYKCFMSQFQTNVAVKMVSNQDDLDDEDKASAEKNLLAEIKIVDYVGEHENVLQLLGVCYDEVLFIVTEYCENGSMLIYLRSLAAQNTIPPNYELLQYCIEISSGMVYLEQKNIIHGDLSARNVLLNGDKVCKISDFGLSRMLEEYEKYMKKGEEPLPWRWMAPESLTRKEFSIKSDMWSMGVTFWEIFSMGKVPYPNMTWNNSFCDKLAAGMRLEKPGLCSDSIYHILMSCWNILRKCRPSAEEVFSKLRKLKMMEYVVM